MPDEQAPADETTVSDAIDESRPEPEAADNPSESEPGALSDQLEEVLDAIDDEPAESEPERKARIKKEMRTTARKRADAKYGVDRTPPEPVEEEPTE